MQSNSLFLRKIILALTGLFLCLFLIVHLSANCLLLLPESIARELYNAYSAWLRENPFIQIIAYLLYISILLHVLYAILVTIKNKKANPTKYALSKSNETSTWASQNMGFLGMLILIFIVIHLINFWAKIKLGIGQEVVLDSQGNEDVYGVAFNLFQNIYYTLFYTILMIPLGFHLHHGLKSAFMTLGFYHKKGLVKLANVSLIYALFVSALFAIIPFVVFFKGFVNK